MINPETQCGARERADRFFRSGYPCVLAEGHEGDHQSCDGQWAHEDSVLREMHPEGRKVYDCAGFSTLERKPPPLDGLKIRVQRALEAAGRVHAALEIAATIRRVE